MTDREANGKITKDDADYQDSPGPNGKACAKCSMFRPFPSGHCTLVRGAILRDGYCKHWESRG